MLTVQPDKGAEARMPYRDQHRRTALLSTAQFLLKFHVFLILREKVCHF